MVVTLQGEWMLEIERSEQRTFTNYASFDTGKLKLGDFKHEKPKRKTWELCEVIHISIRSTIISSESTYCMYETCLNYLLNKL